MLSYELMSLLHFKFGRHQLPLSPTLEQVSVSVRTLLELSLPWLLFAGLGAWDSLVFKVKCLGAFLSGAGPKN